MTIRFSLQLLADRQGQKTEVVRDELVEGAAAGTIIAVIGTDVELYRQMEILSGWEKLWNGIRDRNLLPITNATLGPIYTAFSIDSRTENNRRTSWADIPGFLTTRDILIGVHNDVAQQLEATNMVQNGFQMIIDHVRESQELS